MGYEIIEHTADVGIRAEGRSLTEVFEHATLGLLDIAGAYQPNRSGEPVSISVEARDVEGLLVDWLSEVLYLQDARDIVITDVRVESVSETAASGYVNVSPRTTSLEGTAVKAITYHALEVVNTSEGWVAQVFVDI
jgi:SHS2 domain-containing protein